jgi:AcrR family transcriptional regulator
MAEPALTRETQSERRARTRGKLVDATVERLFDAGLAGTTTPEIQRATGVAPGGLHYYFPTKADLLGAAFVKIVEDRYDAVCAAAEELEQLTDTADRVREAVRVLWRETLCPASQAALELIRAARQDPQLRAQIVGSDPTLRPARDVSLTTLFGAEVAALPNFKAVVELLHLSLYGVALVAEFMTEERRGQVAANIEQMVLQQLGIEDATTARRAAAPGTRRKSTRVAKAN